MGVVYRARDTALDREVAVKLLSERYPPDSLPAQRFLSEARITGQLQHPGIPAVHQVGTLADGRPFLAMKLIKGSTLEAILKYRPDPRPIAAAPPLAVFEAVCQAVGYAHAHRVIHRDLKPANVMVGAFGEVQVMDWGLAKVLGEASAGHGGCAVSGRDARRGRRSAPRRRPARTRRPAACSARRRSSRRSRRVGEIEKVDERTDVFGLGAILAVILTGKPPYVGETSESVRVQAVRGKLDDCFARLDACGAEPELVALCKRCLAFEPADRPADAGAVAAAVAGLRAAADERARRAELEKVRVEGEKAAAEARSAERRKRRRLAAAAAAVLAAAVVGGLTAVLAVQRRANADLAAKNPELADEQAKVQARFELAQKAIAMFHTGVSEDMLLKNPEFKELRTKLLKQAADFYADLEKLLAGQTDARSRKALAAGYFQLGELTDKIGSKPEALAVHRKALAVRRELAAAEGADVETRLDVARSLEKVGLLLRATGDNAGALAAFEEALAIDRKLADDNPAVTDYQSGLASIHLGLGPLLSGTGKPSEAEVEYRKSLATYQKLADDHPAVPEYQSGLASIHMGLGALLWGTGKPSEAEVEFRESVAIYQKLADDNPAVPEYRLRLSWAHNDLGLVLAGTGKPSGVEFRKALAISQKLADENPAVTTFQSSLAHAYVCLGELDKARAIYQKLVDDNPSVVEFRRGLAHEVYLRVAPLQAWLGQDKEYSSTCENLLSLAKDTEDSMLADTAAKCCSLRPADPERREAAARSRPSRGGTWEGFPLPGFLRDGPRHGRIPVRTLRGSRRRFDCGNERSK